jgi:ubiquinone biosynthesis protein COQ9
MSIEMDNPETPLEKADALSNLIEQMAIAHRISDEQMFKIAYDKAADLGFSLVQDLQSEEE